MQNKPLTSILFLAYDTSQLMRNVTQRSLSTIIQYTDEEDYELIFMDVIPKGRADLWWNKHYENEVFQFDTKEDRTRITLRCDEEEDPGQYACYNRMAKMAKGEYLCFFQNDIFVSERWLTNMKYYLDMGLAKAVFPDQWPRTRGFMLESYRLCPKSPEAMKGARDAGILLVTREEFDRVGGWDEDMRIHYGEKDIYNKLQGQVTTRKTTIVHLEHGAGWEKRLTDEKKYNEDVKISADKINEKG